MQWCLLENWLKTEKNGGSRSDKDIECGRKLVMQNYVDHLMTEHLSFIFSLFLVCNRNRK